MRELLHDLVTLRMLLVLALAVMPSLPETSQRQRSEDEGGEKSGSPNGSELELGGTAGAGVADAKAVSEEEKQSQMSL